MAKNDPVDPGQLDLFDEDISSWPQRLIRPRSRGAAPSWPPPRQLDLFTAPAPSTLRGSQLDLLRLPQISTPQRRRRHRNRLKRSQAPQTYLDLACSLGLPRLQSLVNLPATYFVVDASPLRHALGVDTLLEARYYIEEAIIEAFEDLAELDLEGLAQSGLTFWGGRRLMMPKARSPRGEALILAVSSEKREVQSPFTLRFRGLPGFIESTEGPSPLEDGDELLSVYERQTLYPLLPEESQPMALEDLLAG